MNLKNKTSLSPLNKTIYALIFSISVFVGITAQSAEKTPHQVRVHHAKELLGKHYKKSVVKKSENVENIRKFVLAGTKESLSKENKKYANSISRAILKQSQKYNYDPIFLMAIIDHESTFNPTVRGSHGEIGLMQIRPETAEWICEKYDIKWKGEKSLFDPATNIQIGAAYLDYLRDRFAAHGRLYLAAYNMGVTNVNRALDKQIWPRDYPSAVMTHYVKFYTELSKLNKPGKAGKGKAVVLAKTDTLSNEITQ